MTRDTNLFVDPEIFLPERFLEAVDEATARKRDPANYVFGFGRRSVSPSICASLLRLTFTLLQAMPRRASRRRVSLVCHCLDARDP